MMVGEDNGARTLTTDTNCLQVCKIGLHFQVYLWESINTVVHTCRERGQRQKRKRKSHSSESLTYFVFKFLRLTGWHQPSIE